MTATGPAQPAKPTVFVVENPQEDPTWATFGEVDVVTLTAYPFSKWADPDEAFSYTEDQLAVLRRGQLPDEQATWLREWLSAELACRERDFTVDWDTLRIDATYQASFSPEAWIRDEAVPVDPQGDTTWDCTAFVAQHQDYFDQLAARAGSFDDDGLIDSDDLLAGDPVAPDWVRSWQGPFTIRVTRTITDPEQD